MSNALWINPKESAGLSSFSMSQRKRYLTDEFEDTSAQYWFTLAIFLSENTAQILQEGVVYGEDMKHRVILFKYRDEFLVYILTFNEDTQKYEQSNNYKHIPDDSVTKKYANVIKGWNMSFVNRAQASEYMDYILKHGITLTRTLGEDGTIYLIEQTKAYLAKNLL